MPAGRLGPIMIRPLGVYPLRRAVGLLATLASVALPVLAQTAPNNCGNPFNAKYGPFDYRTTGAEQKSLVETYHFTPLVEALLAGQSTNQVGGDIGYTLRAFPNHHRALIAMMNLGAKLKTPLVPQGVYTVECYFERAIVFRPDDAIVRMIYAKFLSANGRKEEATKQLEVAATSAQDNGFTHYNIGLIYLEMGESDKALAEAQKAQQLGFMRDELKGRLVAAGKWVDPPAEAASAPAASAPAQ